MPLEAASALSKKRQAAPRSHRPVQRSRHTDWDQDGGVPRLLSRGFPVTILGNRRRAPVDRLISRGATEAASPRALAAAASTIVLCLPCSGTVESLVAELKPSLVAERHTIIDTGTSSLESTAALSAALDALGVGFAEAPLTGGKAQAREGVLGALVGCDAATFARVEPVLSAFCSTVEHFGGVGAGGRAKLINNGMVIGMAALVIEAFRKVGGTRTGMICTTSVHTRARSK